MRTCWGHYVPSLRLIRRTYYSPVLARKYVKASRFGLTLVIRTTLLVVVVQDAEIAATNVFAGKDMSNEL